MSSESDSSRAHRSSQAEEYYQKGLTLKAAGQPDRALTEFRRAVLSDPSHANAHYEVGLLTKLKAGTEPHFLRYAYEAFRNAAKLDLNNQQAHDQYIMMGQKMGRLDEIHREYDALAKAHPENPLFARCAKNIVTLSMALMPDQVNLSSSGNTSGIRKVLLFSSIGLILLGFALIFGPPINNKFSKTKMDPSIMKQTVVLGFIAIAGGAGGFYVRARFAH
jgi:tetratricopeptide (TPR) repeat protein